MLSIREQLEVVWERQYHEITQYAASEALTNYKALIKPKFVKTAKFEVANYSTLGRWGKFNMGNQLAGKYPKKQWTKVYDVKDNEVGMGFTLPVYQRDLEYYEEGTVALRNPEAMREQITAFSMNFESTLDNDVFTYLLANETITDGVALISDSHLVNAQAGSPTFSNKLTTGFDAGIQDTLISAMRKVDAFVDANGIPLVNRRMYFNTISCGPKWYDKVVAIVGSEKGASGVAGEQEIRNPVSGKFKVLNVPYFAEGGAYEDFIFITAEPKTGISSFEMIRWGTEDFRVDEIAGQSQERLYHFKGQAFKEIGCRDALWVVGYIG